MSIVVDLPAPLGPSSATVSPAVISNIDAAHRADRPVRAAKGLDQAAELDLRRWFIRGSHRRVSGRISLDRAEASAHLRACLAVFIRSVFPRTTLRMRTFSGVTSTHSSSRTNSSASSSVNLR